LQKSALLAVILASTFSLSAFQASDGPLLSGSKHWEITVTPSIGYLYGEAREIVYDDSDTDDYLSELIWDLSDLFYAGGTVSFNAINRFYINTGFWASISSGTGYMNDFDWIDGETESDGYDRYNWTRWSLSEVEVLESYIIDINASYDFLARREHKLSGLIGFKSLYWDWNDEVSDSYYDGVSDVVEVGVNAIDYQLLMLIPYIGTVYGYTIKEFYISGKLLYSPAVFAYDHDHHILTSTHYYDEYTWGHYFSLSLFCGYRFSQLFSISLQLNGEYVLETRGSIAVYNESSIQTGYYSDQAGLQYESMSFSVNASFHY
jgi:outer membrane protease